MKFRELQVGQTFDFVSPNGNSNSFFRPCMKTSTRKYRTIGGGPIQAYTVGSINVEVYHVDEHGE